jgi:hypothetical protein
LNVRAKPAGKNLGTHRLGDQGTVIGGPALANGYTWYQIDYDTNPDGWSVQDYLTKLTVASTPSSPQLTQIATTLSTMSELLSSPQQLSSSTLSFIANALNQIQMLLNQMRR